jgi:hypothetical protein
MFALRNDFGASIATVYLSPKLPRLYSTEAVPMHKMRASLFRQMFA